MVTPVPMLAAYRDTDLSTEAAEQFQAMANDPTITRHVGRDLPESSIPDLITALWRRGQKDAR